MAYTIQKDQNHDNAPIQLSFSGAQVQVCAARLSALRAHFYEHDWVRLPCLLEEPLLQRIVGLIQAESFLEVSHEDMRDDTELRLNDCAGERALELVHNNSQLFRLVEEVAQCDHIGSFLGRTYRFERGSGHQYRWHTDVADSRLVGLSLNLSTERYQGGDLHIRKCGRPNSEQRVENTVLGDALIFRIAEDTEHRVAPVVSTQPKTAFAGWFCAHPEFDDRLLKL
ncbi:MAG: 2OG-Fe(II) oxygenase [Halioglobus sp.]